MREPLPQRLTWRIETIAALERVQQGRGDEAELLRFAKLIHQHGNLEGDAIWAYAELVGALAMVTSWKQYIRNRDPKRNDCQEAANQRASDALDARRPEYTWPQPLEDAAFALRDLDSPNGVVTCATKLLAVSLPSRITNATRPDRQGPIRHASGTHTGWGPISIRLMLEGRHLRSPFGMKDRTIYEVGVAVQWPAGQVPPGPLEVSFEHDLSDQQAEFKPVKLAPDARSAATNFELRSSLASPRTRKPVKVVATLHGGRWPRRVDVIGYPQFDIATHDPTYDRPLGTSWGPKVDEMVAYLDQRLPNLSIERRNDFITLYQAICNYGQLALTNRLFPDGAPTSERAFQTHLRNFLQLQVGLQLREGDELAGGELDLLFRDINLELKFEKDHAVNPIKVTGKARQAAYYGSALASPVSILCVMDASPKSKVPGVLANYMAWSEPPLHGLPAPEVPALVAVLVVPVGFGAPHDGGRSNAKKERADVESTVRDVD